jgi:ADP-ribosylglycohydrolase
MVGGGPFRLEPGEWTDDTAMALCLATSLVEKETFDPIDQLQRYVRWWREGYLSSNGRCFDIGNTFRAALHRFEETGDPFCGSVDPEKADNGSLIRLAPIPMFFVQTPQRVIEAAAESSRTTHAAATALDACRYFSGLIVGALTGCSKEELLSARYAPEPGYWDRHPLTAKIDEVAAGSFRRESPPEIRGTGYVVRALEAALWAFGASSSYREGCLLAVNLGEDADSTAAIYGQLAGAYYGEESIPARWRFRLAKYDMIAGLADKLYELSQRPNSVTGPGRQDTDPNF